MKTKLLLATALFFSTLSYAQINKGSVLLGGTVYASSNKMNSSNQQSHDYSQNNIGLYGGIATKNNRVIGLGFSYGYSKNEQEVSDYKGQEKSYKASVFLRQYIPVSKAFSVFGEAGTGFFLSESKRDQSGVSDWNYYYDIFLTGGVGIDYALTRKLHLQTGLGQLFGMNYFWQESGRDDNPYTDKTKGFNFAASAALLSNLYIGLQLVL